MTSLVFKSYPTEQGRIKVRAYSRCMHIDKRVQVRHKQSVCNCCIRCTTIAFSWKCASPLVLKYLRDQREDRIRSNIPCLGWAITVSAAFL